MKNSLGILCVVSAALMTGVSCKRNVSGEAGSESSGFKTLDNFAAGTDHRTNECRGSVANIIPDNKIVLNGAIFSGPNKAKVEAEYRGYVKEYLSSVPTDVQRVFNALNGEILVTDKAQEICSQPFADGGSSQFVAEGRRKVESCFVYATNADQTQAWFTVIHKPEAKVIRHGGLRVFGSIYAQFIPRLALNANTSAKQKFVLQENETIEFANYKSRISAKFVSDLKTKKVYDINNLQPLLGENVAKHLASKAEGDLNALKDLKIKYKGEHVLTDPAKINIALKRFDDFVFAEAFDSFRCSGKSLEVMKDEFPTTHSEYLALDANILAVAKSIANKMEAVNGQSSLALTDSSEMAPSAQLQQGGIADLLAMLAPLLSGATSQGVKQTGTTPNTVGSDGGSTAAQIISSLPTGQLAQMFNDMGGQLASCGCQGGNCSCSGGCAGGCSCQSGGGCSGCAGGCASCAGVAG